MITCGGNHPLAAQSSLAAQTYLLRNVDLKLETISAQCIFHILLYLGSRSCLGYSFQYICASSLGADTCLPLCMNRMAMSLSLEQVKSVLPLESPLFPPPSVCLAQSLLISCPHLSSACCLSMTIIVCLSVSPMFTRSHISGTMASRPLGTTIRSAAIHGQSG